MYQIKINGMPFSVPKGSTILEAARFAGIKIPTLCFLKDLNEIGACRVCVVEVKGARSLVAACVHPVNEGMEFLQILQESLNPEKQHFNYCFLSMKESVYSVCAMVLVNCSNFAQSWE